MVLKRKLKEGGEEGSQLPNKHRNLASTILRGPNYARTLQDFVPSLEPMIRKWVREETHRAIDSFLRPSYKQIDCSGSGSGSRTLHLQIHGDLPHKIFTGSRVMSEDKTPLKIVLYDSSSKMVITSGPLSSVKANIIVVDGDFGPEEWTKNEFDKNVVQNREGKRPLVTGELIVPLQNGVGYIGEVSFTDNSSWIRSGKFRLAAVVTGVHELSIREGMSNSFKVKDHRGESYQKHYPPQLDDEVWRLEKIAKDGASHKRLSQSGITSVRDFLRLFVTNQFQLRSRFANVSNKTWDTIIRHAKTCTLDDKKYIYVTAQGTGLLFNSIYEVVGATFDGQTYNSLDNLNLYQMSVVGDLKQYAYRNSKDLILVCDPSFVGYPMLLPSSAPQNFTNHNLGFQDVNFQVEQDRHELQMNNDHRSISPPYNSEVEQDNRSFELGQNSHQMQSFINPTFKNSFLINDSPGGFYNLTSHLSTDDIPIDDNFQVGPSSSAWQANGLFVGSHEIGILSSNSGLVIPRNKARWCKVVAVVKWRILKRKLAAKKLRRFHYYM